MLSGRGEGAGDLPAPDFPHRYTSPRLLARGGMGTVWCAEDGVLGRRVAIKVLGENFAGDGAAVRRFMREARAAAHLSGHRHVITIFDVGDAGGRPYIVMEHLAGGTVADALRIGAYSQREALQWLEQAAAALDHAHRREVIHRDVKPANMLLGTDRVLRLADFGIASLGTEQTLSNTGELFGTAAYLSPEQAVGDPATAAGDRYSLAVAAFELLTGTRPFAGDTFAAQARAHIEDPAPSASDRAPELPAAVDAVLARGMAKAPDERWPSAQSFAEGLRAAAEGRDAAPPRAAAPSRPASRRPGTPPRRPGPPPRRSAPAARRSGGTPPLIFESVASAERRSLRAPAVAVAGVALIALAAGAVVGLGAGGSGGVPHTLAADASPGHLATLAPKAGHSTATATTATVARSATEAAALEARGHSLMDAGSYDAALPVLREAVATAPTSTLTYAYALFDLGRTLRLSGDPSAAIPILEQRLQIPNQPAVVEQELTLANAAAAQQTDTGTTQTATTPTSPTGTSTSPTTPTTTTTTGSGTTTAPGTATAPTTPTGGAGVPTTSNPPAPTGGAPTGPPAGPPPHGHHYGHSHSGRHAPSAQAAVLPDLD